MKKMTLAIDPGIRTMGACLFHGQKLLAASTYKVRRPTERRQDGIFAMINQLEHWLDEVRPPRLAIDRIVCELPENFGSAVGMAAAARGDVVWLSFCVGVLAGRSGDTGQEFDVYPVREWKGNMSKAMTAKRIEKRLKETGVEWRLLLSRDRSHDWDACGVGLHSLGLEL